MSRNNVSSEEWMLHPLAFREFGKSWQGSSRPLRLQRHSHCLICFTRSTDALAHEWPSLPLYAFPPVVLLPPVLQSSQGTTAQADSNSHSGSADAGGALWKRRRQGALWKRGCRGVLWKRGCWGGALWKCGAGRDQRRRRKAGWYQQ